MRRRLPPGQRDGAILDNSSVFVTMRAYRLRRLDRPIGRPAEADILDPKRTEMTAEAGREHACSMEQTAAPLSERREMMTVQFPGQPPKTGIVTWATQKPTNGVTPACVWPDGTKISYAPYEGD